MPPLYFIYRPLRDCLSFFRRILCPVAPGQRTTAGFTVFYRDLAVGMFYQVKGELAAPVVNINPVAKTFVLIEFHFVSP